MLNTLFSFDGRIGRGKFFGLQLLTMMLPVIGVAIILLAISANVGDIFYYAERYGVVTVFADLLQYSTAATFIWIALTLTAIGIGWSSQVRRLHDLGYSGWVAIAGCFINLIPIIGTFIGIVYVLWMYLAPGQPCDNQYGRVDNIASQVRDARWNQPRVAGLRVLAPEITSTPNPAMTKLKMRLANGEITVEQFKELSELLA